MQISISRLPTPDMEDSNYLHPAHGPPAPSDLNDSDLLYISRCDPDILSLRFNGCENKFEACGAPVDALDIRASSNP